MHRKYLILAAGVAVASLLSGVVTLSSESLAGTLKFGLANTNGTFTLIQGGRGMRGGIGGMRGGTPGRGQTGGGTIGQREGPRGGAMDQGQGRRGGPIGQLDGARGGFMERGGTRGRAARGEAGRVQRRSAIGAPIIEGRGGVRRKAFFSGGRWWYGRSCYTNCRAAGFAPGYCDRLCY
jgi:hypothetical protein